MNTEALPFIKLLFLLGLTLHNIEEAVWLPKWSKHAIKFHKPVLANEFYFAVLVITLIGYLLTGADYIFGSSCGSITCIYLGFVGMMGLNVFIPHLAATIVLKRYSPGLITGLLLNLPSSVYTLCKLGKWNKPYNANHLGAVNFNYNWNIFIKVIQT